MYIIKFKAALGLVALSVAAVTSAQADTTACLITKTESNPFFTQQRYHRGSPAPSHLFHSLANRIKRRGPRWSTMAD